MGRVINPLCVLGNMEFHWAKSHPHKRTTSPSTLIGIAWCSSSRWKEINNRTHWRCHCEEQCVVCSVKAAQHKVAAERIAKSQSHRLGHTGPSVAGDLIVGALFVLPFVWSCNKQQLCREGQLLLLVTVDNEILSFMEKKQIIVLELCHNSQGIFVQGQRMHSTWTGESRQQPSMKLYATPACGYRSHRFPVWDYNHALPQGTCR